MKKLAKILSVAALSTVLLTGCGLDKKDVLFTVNDVPVTKKQYNENFELAAKQPIFAQNGVDITKDPDSFMGLMIRERVVDELIVKTLLDNEIKKQNIKVDKADVDKEIEGIIEKIGSKEKFNEMLKQNNVSTGKFKEDLEEQLKIQKLVDGLSIVKISDSDARKFYDENPDQFRYPDKVKASHILIAFNPEAAKAEIAKDSSLTPAQVSEKVNAMKSAKRQKAVEILNKVKADPSKFEQVARESSEDPGSKAKGGDLGYFAKEEMVEPFSNAAFSQKPATVGNIVETPYGFHIIMVKDRVAAGVQPFEKIKNDLKIYLERREKMTVFSNLVKNLRENAKIEYLDPAYDAQNIQKEIKEKLSTQAQGTPVPSEKPVVKKK